MTRNVVFVCACALILALPAPASAAWTYLALGDSLAFGETDFTQNPSNGDRGYVSLFASHLAAFNNGVTPNVVNLAVDGESSSTFFAGAANNAFGPNANLSNSNYANATTPQNTLLLQTIAAQQAAGNTIPYVTVSLGANDLYGLVSNPSFFSQTAAQQQAQVLAALGTVQANYTNLLFELKSLLPHAQVVLVGYYNPFAALTGTPIAAVAPAAITGLNSVIAGEAAAFGATYIDTYSAFLGKEAADTYITTLAFGSPNIHPTADGYQMIEQQLSVVPEPGSFCLMGLGLAALSRWALPCVDEAAWKSVRWVSPGGGRRRVEFLGLPSHLGGKLCS